MNYDFRFTNKITFGNGFGFLRIGYRSSIISFLSIFFFLFSFSSFSQVTSSIDSTKIKIGEQITYKIEVETSPSKLVVFPEGQTFMPLEMIDSYPVDTIKNKDKYNLIKKYGLTQFDSGAYTIPRQKIIVGDKTFFTDSLKVEVNNIAIDTTKQGLYDIKPIIEVKEIGSDWWKYLLYTLLALAIVGGLLYWFIWRKKPLTEAEQIALLPPYDRAKLALKKLDEANYLENEAIKDYYSELTFIIRKYLDEKVYDKALESTTDELINRLNLLKEGNQIDLSKEDIINLERILKRADLVKFAKSAPDIELAKFDRNTIDIEIDHVKEALPEPTEEEKLLDAKYKEELERRNKRKKIWLTVGICVFLLLATLTGFSIKYGFGYVKDTILGHDTKELLEGDWVTSDYGFPPITISTPKVLKRLETPLSDELKGKMKLTTFGLDKSKKFTLFVSNTTLAQAQDSIDINKGIEGSLKTLESKGARNILSHNEKFVTPNGAEGVKTTGTMQYPIEGTQNFVDGKYILLSFVANNQVIQQILMAWPQNDNYSDDMAERILNSVELKKAEE
ncbi:BatD family protein [Confluentibacter sediminis]|uniref:BatD family protein n=1 Tax=Confluentibacter sediminis TaxID=2219045 RepID=UPI001F3AE65C|nr:BatD family protein [Confluentibacter sediminis]